MRESERVGATLREWLIEEDTEEPRERVFFRNGRYYYENTETEEFIYLGEWDSQPSATEWTSNRTLHKGYRIAADTVVIPVPGNGGNFLSLANVQVTSDDIERVECYEPWWNIADGMGAWSPDPSLVFPYHWVCQVCNLQNPQAHDTCQSCERASRVPRPPRFAGDATLTTTAITRK